MANINDIPEGEHRERIRREVLDNIDERRQAEEAAMSRLSTYLGIVSSGVTIALLGLIGQQLDSGVSVFAVAGFLCSAGAVLAFAYLLYHQFQLHSSRYNLVAEVSQRFFMGKASLEDVLVSYLQLRSSWAYRLLFWVPFMLLLVAFVLGALAVFGMGCRLPLN